MSELYELFEEPQISSVPMVVALEGWIDAGSAASGAMQTLLELADTDIVAAFDTDQLLDHRARRPIMTLEDGYLADLAWPRIELRYGTDTAGNHALFLVGAEPDHGWNRFSSAVGDLIEDFDVSMVIGLGAYPAPVPHTRETRLALTSPSRPLLDSFTGFFKGSVEVPAGIQAVIEAHAFSIGVSALGLWAQVPHYIAGMAYPQASVALIDGLARVAPISFLHGSLTAAALETSARIDELIGDNEQHLAMVHQLEELVDSNQFDPDFGPLPSGDEIAAELQRFLRDQQN